MLKFLLPTYYSKSIFDINIEFFKANNISIVISDLDNTLDGFNILKPSKRVVDLKNKFNENGIELIVISNNKTGRVENYSNMLGVKRLASAQKPLARKINKFFKENNINKDNCILVGDQLLTDCLFAKNTKMKIILTDPIVKIDQWTTKFNRIIDRPIRKYFKKKKLLREVN